MGTKPHKKCANINADSRPCNQYGDLAPELVIQVKKLCCNTFFKHVSYKCGDNREPFIGFAIRHSKFNCQEKLRRQ